MNIKSILVALGAFISILFFTMFKSYKKGKTDQKASDTTNAVKESLEIKRDENIRLNDDIDVVRDRLRKYARD